MQTILDLTAAEMYALNDALEASFTVLVAKRLQAESAERVDRDRVEFLTRAITANRSASGKFVRAIEQATRDSHEFDLKVGSVSKCRVCNRSRSFHSAA